MCRKAIRPCWSPSIASTSTCTGSLFAASLTAATSFASVWLQDDAGQWTGEFGSRFFWLELVFLLGVGALLLVVLLALVIFFVVLRKSERPSEPEDDLPH